MFAFKSSFSRSLFIDGGAVVRSGEIGGQETFWREPVSYNLGGVPLYDGEPGALPPRFSRMFGGYRGSTHLYVKTAASAYSRGERGCHFQDKIRGVVGTASLHRRDQAGRVEDTACEATDWTADSAVACKVSSGVRSTRRVVTTGVRSWCAKGNCD
jgi:hypothetical protein